MSTIPKVCTKAASEIRNVAVDMRGKLDVGELLDGPPTVEEINGTDLNFANKSVSTADLIIENDTVPAGQAVQFKVGGGTAGRVYHIRITVETTAVPPQTLIENIKIRVISD